MSASQIASVCVSLAQMAVSRADVEAWVAANRETIERAIPAHADDVIQAARDHWRRLA